MKFLIKSTTRFWSGNYYMSRYPFMTRCKKDATEYDSIPPGLFNKEQARLIYVWPKDENKS